jgi:zinc transporter 7
LGECGPTARTGLKLSVFVRGAIFVGFAAFFVLDKTMRVLSASADPDSGHGHSYGHSHTHTAPSEGESTAVSSSNGKTELRSRKSPEDVSGTTPAAPEETAQPNPSLRLSAYLNLFGDFTHNITDGLAMAASFYSSPVLGAVTTIATFCHEIPHEVSPHSTPYQD